MLKRTLFCLMLAGGCGIAATAQAQQFIYKWTDEQGQLKYSELPPPTGVTYEMVRKPSGPSSGVVQPGPDLAKEQEKKAAEEAAKQKEQEEQAKKESADQELRDRQEKRPGAARGKPGGQDRRQGQQGPARCRAAGRRVEESPERSGLFLQSLNTPNAPIAPDPSRCLPRLTKANPCVFPAFRSAPSRKPRLMPR